MSGAEFGLAVFGVALAWKGILDFAAVVITLCRNDGGDRLRLSQRAQVELQCFKEWGERYQVEAYGGIYSRFGENKKTLIEAIMKAFLSDNIKAMRKLNRYAAIDGDMTKDGESFRRVVKGFKTQIAKRIQKVPWNVKDRQCLTEYIEEMERTNDMFKLTQYEGALLQSQSVDIKEDTNNDRLLIVDGRDPSPRPPETAPESRGLLKHAEDDTSSIRKAVTVSVDHTDDLEMMYRVKELGTRAYYAGVDIEICQKIIEWWQTESSILKLESLIGQEEVCELACAALYVCAQHPKLIYMFDRRVSRESPLELFATMIYSLIKQWVVYASSASSQGMILDSPDPFQDQVDITNKSREAIEAGIDLLGKLLVATSPSDRGLLVVLNGLEDICSSGEVGDLGLYFIASLEQVCSQRAAQKDSIKVLFTCQGRGETFVGHDSHWDVWQSTTDEPPEVDSLMHYVPLLFSVER